MSGWDAYITSMLLASQSADGSWTQNVNEGAAIIGLDGVVWAKSENFNLLSYEAEVATETGGTQKVAVNEVATLLAVLTNEGKVPKEHVAGLRLNNEKYFVVKYDQDSGSVYLKSSRGGGAIARSNSAYIIAVFNKELQVVPPAGGKAVPQNPGLTNKVVEALAEYLKGQGY